VRLDRPLAPLGDGYAVRFRVDPVAGDTGSLGWVSVIFMADPDGLGWVTRPDASPGFLVRSNGAVQLFHRGVERAVTWAGEAPSAASVYDVALRVALDEGAGGARLLLRGAINGAGFEAVLAAGAEASLPSPVWLSFGAHYHPGDEPVSWIDDVRVDAAAG